MYTSLLVCVVPACLTIKDKLCNFNRSQRGYDVTGVFGGLTVFLMVANHGGSPLVLPEALPCC